MKILLMCTLLTVAAYPQAPSHMEKRGQATQLIVDGKPFLALSGELANTAPSNLDYMRHIFPILASQVHLNTVLTAMAWAWIEPQEDKYDFHLADAAIELANKSDLRIAWLWFGSWKNGESNFTPGWVKANQDRFPRAQIQNGKSVEILSTLSQSNWQADARAFAALMRHVREVDKNHRVIMAQVENEVGLLGDSRDRSPAANEAFAKPVPKEFMDYLQKHKEDRLPALSKNAFGEFRFGAADSADNLLPEFRKIWEAAGFKTSGTWEEVFGKGVKTDEIFMGWNYARYLDKVAEAGKREYNVPMFANAWLNAPADKGPGDYPSGGPQAHMHDIWRAGAPHIDMLCPDIYATNFSELAALYSRSGNPLFIPESAGDIHGAANAIYAIAQHKAVGYSMMGVGELQRMTAFRAGDAPPTAPADVENLPLPQAYATLTQLAPLVLEHQSNGTIGGAWLNKDNPDTQIKLGGYILNVSLWGWGRRSVSDVPIGFNATALKALDVVPDSMGYGIFMATGPDEFLMAGDNVLVTFSAGTPGPAIVSLAEQEAGRFENGKWVVTRYLGGDDSTLRRDLANAVAMNQSGFGVRLFSQPHLSFAERAIQRVKVYRYK
ncbi:MAG: DUF5597 domain-containing protein [Bryobacteraceae bacterium]